MYVDDAIFLASPALTANASHEAMVACGAAPIDATEPETGARLLEANITLVERPRLTIGRYATRAPCDVEGEIDALQYVRLMHREDDSLLVASTNSLAKQRSRSLGARHAGEPYLRHMSRKAASPGKGMWAYELEDPTRGGPLLHGARVRLRHACSGLYLAVRYSSSPDRDPSLPELVALVGRDCRARSLFSLRSVKETAGGSVPSQGYACLITHDVTSSKGRVASLSLRCAAGKAGKAHSSHVHFVPKASMVGAIEIHLAAENEGFRLQTLLACRADRKSVV